MPTWVVTRRDGLQSTLRVVTRSDVEPGELERLRNEAQLLHELDHTNIVRLHGWYGERDFFCTAKEFCGGEWSKQCIRISLLPSLSLSLPSCCSYVLIVGL